MDLRCIVSTRQRHGVVTALKVTWSGYSTPYVATTKATGYVLLDRLSHTAGWHGAVDDGPYIVHSNHAPIAGGCGLRRDTNPSYHREAIRHHLVLR